MPVVHARFCNTAARITLRKLYMQLPLCTPLRCCGMPTELLYVQPGLSLVLCIADPSCISAADVQIATVDSFQVSPSHVTQLKA
jgi:hypothetical protein